MGHKHTDSFVLALVFLEVAAYISHIEAIIDIAIHLYWFLYNLVIYRCNQRHNDSFALKVVFWRVSVKKMLCFDYSCTSILLGMSYDKPRTCVWSIWLSELPSWISCKDPARPKFEWDPCN